MTTVSTLDPYWPKEITAPTPISILKWECVVCKDVVDKNNVAEIVSRYALCQKCKEEGWKFEMKNSELGVIGPTGSFSGLHS